MPAVEPDNLTPWGEQPHHSRPRANPHVPAPQAPPAFAPAPPAPLVVPPPPPLPVHQAPPPGYAPHSGTPPPPPSYAPPAHAPSPVSGPQYGPATANGSSFTSEKTSNEKLGKRIVLASIVVVVAAFALFGYRALAPKTWDPALEPYVAFVEAERGLEFTDTVDVRRANIAAELEEQAGPAGAAPSDVVDPWSEAYRLLGLVDPDPAVTSEEAFNDTLVENAGAFYEPWSETIVLPEGSTDIELSVTIVHELTHALQHQHGMLGGSGLFESPDDAVARRTLIEGDAERVAMAWFWVQPESFREEYRVALGFDEDTVFEDSGDNYLGASFYASYEVGAPMVRTIVEVDGVERLNELLRAKNVGSTERLVDPLGNSPLSSVDALESMTLPDGAEEPIGDLGALTWFQALAPVIGTSAAFDSLVGYDDDAFALFEQAGQSCVRYSIFFDTPADGTEFIAALDNANAPGDRQLVESQALIDLCSPLGDPQDQKFGTTLPLIVAHEAAHTHLLDGETVEVARCAAIAQASTIPAVSFEDFVGWDVVIEQEAQFVADCK